MRNDDAGVGPIAFFLVMIFIGSLVYLTLSPIFDKTTDIENEHINGNDSVIVTQERADAKHIVDIYWAAFLIFAVLIPAGIYLWITAMREKGGYA